MTIRFDSSYRTMCLGRAEWRLSLGLWDAWRDFCRELWEAHVMDASLFQGGIVYQMRQDR